MRFHVLGVAVAAALLAPHAIQAQVYMLPNPAPSVTAAHAEWQRSGEPIFHAGGFYYPTGPTEFFDGRVLVRTGTYKGIPLYENGTLEPYSLVFVPIGRNLVRPYERRREGELVGTTGSRMPSFPIQRDSEVALLGLSSTMDDADRIARRAAGGRARWDWPTPETPIDEPALAPLASRPVATTPAPVIRSVPTRETTNAGAFVQFQGTRFYTSGRAVVHDAERFVQAGAVNGAAVFRELKGNDRTIFVEVVPGGALAPYSRR
jgi:hypothetical protein